MAEPIFIMQSDRIVHKGKALTVKAVAFIVSDGKAEEVVYTVETESGAWREISQEDIES